MKPAFHEFLAKFPPIAMPVTLGEDTHHVFGVENQPLSDALISNFIHPTEETVADDEFTEYVPCFSIDNTEQFIAVVWWKAELMNYEYVLATFTDKGELISREVIAGTRVENGLVTRSVAIINEEWEITIGEGTSPDGNNVFDPTTAQSRNLEILVNGQIVQG
ncbi:MAG: hypothetical protein J0M29_05820 [Chitinophagales bacterium]|nr:hypothetical protein [Chitinophagales bacterium]